MRLRKSVRAKWVEALRSGEFDQTTGALAKVDENGTRVGYCCLGVLCELAIADGVEVGTASLAQDHELVVFDGRTDFPPTAVTEWAGLESSHEAEGSRWSIEGFDTNDEGAPIYTELAEANDGGTGFAAIANLLELDADRDGDVED